MRKRLLGTLMAGAALAIPAAPARAWVAAYGGYRGGVAVVRPPCCFGPAYPVPRPPVVAVPRPIYVAPPVPYIPPVGTLVYSLPGSCAGAVVNGISYMQCSGAYYQPFYSGGALVYRVAIP